MLEVVFSDSEKGSIRVAKTYDAEKMKGGAVGYIGEKPRKAQVKKLLAQMEQDLEGHALGGSSDEVVNIGFFLDVGDISGEIDGIGRRNVFRRLWSRFDFKEQEEEQLFVEQRKELDKLMSFAEEGKPIRIWASNAPYSICGLLYVCFLLRDSKCNASVVSLPEYRQTSEHEMIQYTHWGEVPAGKFYSFLPGEKELSHLEKQARGHDWEKLMQENSPLRVHLNGKLVSANEDFYDFFISKNLPEKDFMMARFIGNLLGEYRLGISDSWYAYRLEHMIEEKRLMMVEDKDPTQPYGKILRKV
jgi:hypothetical protein